MNVVKITWMNSLEPSEIEDAMDEACVDAHDEHEQCAGLVSMVMDELDIPFAAKVLGEDVQVVDLATAKHDSFGLDLIVQYRKKQYAIAAGSVEILEPLPIGHLYLAAYLRWQANF